MLLFALGLGGPGTPSADDGDTDPLRIDEEGIHLKGPVFVDGVAFHLADLLGEIKKLKSDLENLRSRAITSLYISPISPLDIQKGGPFPCEQGDEAVYIFPPPHFIFAHDTQPVPDKNDGLNGQEEIFVRLYRMGQQRAEDGHVKLGEAKDDVTLLGPKPASRDVGRNVTEVINVLEAKADIRVYPHTSPVHKYARRVVVRAQGS